MTHKLLLYVENGSRHPVPHDGYPATVGVEFGERLAANLGPGGSAAPGLVEAVLGDVRTSSAGSRCTELDNCVRHKIAPDRALLASARRIFEWFGRALGIDFGGRRVRLTRARIERLAMRFAGVALLAVCAWWPVLGAAQDAVETEKIADLMVRLCVGGGHTEATSGTAAGGADLSLRSLDVKGNLKGEFKINKSSAEGLVNGLDNALSRVAADQADKVRVCLQPVRERLLDVLLPPKKQGSRRETPTAVCADQGIAIVGNVSGSTVTNRVSGGTASAGPCANGSPK
jgi:hypothetical protein